jgi:GT2 family glycosyltransferase
VSRVSVIIPAYQASSLLDTALACVAAQTRPADEVVVVDDASTDDTVEVARRWSEILPLLVIRKDVNEGPGAARRDAIAASSGDLIALLDADDVWLPDHLAVMVPHHEHHGGIVLAQVYNWYPQTRLASRPRHRGAVPRPGRQPRAILDHNFTAPFFLFSRESYDRAGGFRTLRLSEDWDLLIRMIRSGDRLSVTPTVTGIRRLHAANLSADEACLDHDLALLHELRATTEGRDRAVVERAIRRREARRLLVAGYDAARVGNAAQARSLWWRAAVHDRSLHAPLADGAGSVTLRALTCLVAPCRMVGVRDEWAADPDKRPVLRVAR